MRDRGDKIRLQSRHCELAAHGARHQVTGAAKNQHERGQSGKATRLVAMRSVSAALSASVTITVHGRLKSDALRRSSSGEPLRTPGSRMLSAGVLAGRQRPDGRQPLALDE